MSNRSSLRIQILNLDLGDHTSLQRNFKDLMLELIDLDGVGFGGTKYYVDPVNGLDTNNGTGPDDAKLTLAAGYALLTTNLNDMLFIIGGASALTIPTTFVWAKSYTHLIGLSASSRYDGQARLIAAGDSSPLFNITGSGCQFANFRVQHGRGAAGNIINTNVAGLNNSFYKVQFEGPIHATEAGVAFRELVIADGATGNTFIGCTIGTASIQQTVATGRELQFLGDATGCHFEDCIIMSYADSANHELIESPVNIGSEAVMVEFKNCRLMNLDDAITLTKAIEPPTTGNFLLNGCVGIRITAWSSGAKVFVADSSLTHPL